MRAAKERMRIERARAGFGPEPRPVRAEPRFDFGVRDRRTGEVAWAPLKSGNHAAKALRLILKYYR